MTIPAQLESLLTEIGRDAVEAAHVLAMSTARLRNAALPNPNVPDLAIGQKPWQRYTATWERAAVHVFSAENALVANNRLARSGEANYTMDGCLMLARPGSR